MVSILLNLIVGNYIQLKKSLLLVQIVQYISVAYVELVLALVILGNTALIVYWQIFVLAIIVALTLWIVLKVKIKNIAQRETENSVNADGKELITITKAEYEEMKAEIERLRALVGQKGE